jgi:hypothetical protein
LFLGRSLPFLFRCVLESTVALNLMKTMSKQLPPAVFQVPGLPGLQVALHVFMKSKLLTVSVLAVAKDASHYYARVHEDGRSLGECRKTLWIDIALPDGWKCRHQGCPTEEEPKYRGVQKRGDRFRSYYSKVCWHCQDFISS